VVPDKMLCCNRAHIMRWYGET